MTLQLLSEIHVLPRWSIPALLLAGLAIIIYWVKLSSSHVPRSRRLTRRVSLLLMLILLPVLGAALSFADPEVASQRYVILWSLVMLLIGAILITALVDMANNVRLHRNQRLDDMLESIRNNATARSIGDESS